MTPPELGKTAFEVVNALQPTLDKMASKDEVTALTSEVGRLANEMGRMNGTVRGLCEWRAAVAERFRQEDEHSDPPPSPAPPAAPDKAPDIKEILNLVFGWALKLMWAGAALATGLNLAKVTEVLLK